MKLYIYRINGMEQITKTENVRYREKIKENKRITKIIMKNTGNLYV